MYVRLFMMFVLACLGSVPARAADLAGLEPVRASTAYNWTGLYLGGHAGYGWGTGDAQTDGTPTQHPKGWLGGGQIGYNLHLPSNIVIGLEADASLVDASDAKLDGNTLRLSSEIDYFGTARVRIGYAFDRFLPYLTVGMAWAHARGGMSCPDGARQGSMCNYTGPFSRSDTSTSVGWTVGAGAEYAFADRWSAKLEYLYTDLGTASLTIDVPEVGATTAKVDQTFNVMRFGLNYSFGG